MNFRKKCDTKIDDKKINNSKEKYKTLHWVLDIIRYIFGSIIILSAFMYSDWRIAMFLVSGLLFYPFIYKLLSKKIKIKYWIQIVICIVFFILALIAENIYVRANGLYKYYCDENETLIGDKCVSCPEGYTLNIEEKTCTISNEHIEELITSNLDSSTIKSIKVSKVDNKMYEINLEYEKDIVYLHICAQDAIYYGKKILNMGEIKDKTTAIHIKVSENGVLKYNIDINQFNTLTTSTIEENTVLMDANKNNLNKTVSQAKADYINEYKTNCQTYDYKTIFRYVEQYKGKDVKFTGKVVQIIDKNSYRVNVTKDRWGYYDDTVYVKFVDLDGNTPRILEDDIITFYGTVGDLYTYTTVLGASVTIPSVNANYIDLN